MMHGNAAGAGMPRRETTAMLSKALEHYIDPKGDARTYWAREVTFGYGTQDSIRVDYMQFKPLNNSVSGIEKGDFFCYEVKSSKKDFRSPNGHNLIGDYNYYVMTQETYNAVSDEIPYGAGVLIPDAPAGDPCLRSIRKAKRMDRKRPMAECLLMMFRSAARDRQPNNIPRDTPYILPLPEITETRQEFMVSLHLDQEMVQEIIDQWLGSLPAGTRNSKGTHEIYDCCGMQLGASLEATGSDGETLENSRIIFSLYADGIYTDIPGDIRPVRDPDTGKLSCRDPAMSKAIADTWNAARRAGLKGNTQ